jgi:hypothetical protein
MSTPPTTGRADTIAGGCNQCSGPGRSPRPPYKNSPGKKSERFPAVLQEDNGGRPRPTAYPANYGIRTTSPLALNKVGSRSVPNEGRRILRYRFFRGTFAIAQYARFIGPHFPSTRCLCSSRISSAMLVPDRRTSSAKGAFGRHERQDSAGMRLVTAASR